MMKTIIPVWVYVNDYGVNADGTVDPDFLHCCTYEPSSDNAVVLGKTTASFEMPTPDIIKQSKVICLENALNAYRKESLEKIEKLQGRINELRALPQDVA